MKSTIEIARPPNSARALFTQLLVVTSDEAGRGDAAHDALL